MVYICKIKKMKITLGSDGENLIGLWFDGQKYYGSTLKEEIVIKDLPIFFKTKKWLEEYFAGKNPKINLKIKLIGSDFRIKIWNILREIPYGKVITYGEIVKKYEKQYGDKTSARAVGSAIGHNPISIIIPCHRVIGKHNKLTGYAGGIDKKIKLLELEKYNK